jgi:hypothetical protein
VKEWSHWLYFLFTLSYTLSTLAIETAPTEDTKGLLLAKSNGPLQLLILFDLSAALDQHWCPFPPSENALTSVSQSSFSLALPLEIASSALSPASPHTLLR